MKHEYVIPQVNIRKARLWAVFPFVGLVLMAFIIRHVWFVLSFREYRTLTAIWLFYFVATGLQWAVSWMERPFNPNVEQKRTIDDLRVTVCIPVYNEDPVILDRVLFSLMSQTRLPNRVEVVDDGSKIDYAELVEWWGRQCPSGVEFAWIRQENAGKKFAHARTFSSDLADVFVTLDSDTALELRALEEGLKPFVDERVQSVAGLELAWNYNWNLLTRLNSTRQLLWQLVTCSAQNVAKGNVLINRGTFALYRGDLIRDVLDAYVGERFWGRRIKLGDDTFLTTMALCRGRAVQQPSAVCLTMYPENLSHHIRQWTRWMRGTTIRTFWRLRYLRTMSWGWLYTVLGLWLFVGSVASIVIVAVLWPGSASYIQAMIVATVIWAVAMATRMSVVKRSDQRVMGEMGAAALSPAAMLWVMTVLRVVRVYGTVTFLKQGWTTRSDVEIGAEAE